VKKLLGNQSGVALIMVMTSLLILMAIWGEFTFESKLSRIKTTNILDKSQSRLLAESGVELAMTRLKLFKEAYNTWQQNQAAKDSISIQLLNQLWEIPFVYPIPAVPNIGAQVKAAIDEFQKDSLLEGEMKVSIQNVSTKFNLNLIRLSALKQNQQQQGGALGGTQGGDNSGGGGGVPGDQDGDGVPDDQQNLDPNFSMEQQLVNHLTRRFREKGEEDDNFRSRYGNIDVLQLVANLKYYISDRNPRRQNTTQIDQLMDNSEQIFNEAKITPKYGPMTTFSEIYLIPGWDDALVELIRSEFDVFPVVMIDLNKLTENMLKLLIPAINENEIKEFFAYRDNPEDPQFFNSLQDFKRYIVEIANILNETQFDELFTKLQAQGIQFGAAPTLFRVVSEGTMNRSKTTLFATVSMPVQEQQTAGGAQGGNQGTAQGGQSGGTQGTAQGGQNGGTQGTAQGGTQGGTQNTQLLLDPRIIEIQVN
jgi:general secretion pathway protein K